ncbi:MAG: hypothetical protein ACRDVM_06320, partial [Acidimicrobiia bacterium]
TGLDGSQKLEVVVSSLAADDHVLEGPTMGPLTMAETTDGCHLNEQGELILGRQLLAFFGGG